MCHEFFENVENKMAAAWVGWREGGVSAGWRFLIFLSTFLLIVLVSAPFFIVWKYIFLVTFAIKIFPPSDNFGAMLLSSISGVNAIFDFRTNVVKETARRPFKMPVRGVIIFLSFMPAVVVRLSNYQLSLVPK